MKLSVLFKRITVLSVLSILSFSFLSAQEIGLELYSLRNQIKTDVPGTLAKIKSWKIKEIESIGTYGMSRQEFKKLAEKNDLKIVSVAAEYDQLQKDPQSAIDEAKALGAKYIVCFWIPHNGNDFGIEETKKAIEVFSSAGKLIQQNGLTFCYHPHGYEFRPYEGGTLFDYMVKNTDARYVNFEMDVFWIKIPGHDPVALMQKYPDRFPLLHLKDCKAGTPGNLNGHADVESNVILGQGTIDIAAIMRQAKKIGVKHFFIEDESSRSEEQIPKSLAYLKSLK
jgi:sugar phosphate isomerase/epimerase